MNTNNPFANKDISETYTDLGRYYPDTTMTLGGRYRLLAVAGKGGMGVVYKARDEKASQIRQRDVFCAIKVLTEELTHDERAIMALQEEALNAQDLSHENIINVYGFDDDGRWTYVVMEWLEGNNLNGLLLEHKDGVPFSELQKILPPIGEALAYAHRNSLIHRDIKTNNIFLTTTGRVVLIDFGLSYEAGQSMSRLSNGKISGAPEYMSPESFSGGHRPSVSDDIYGLAVTIYELLTGSVPYRSPMCTIRTTETSTAQAPQNLSQTQWQVLQSALSVNPLERPDSVQGFIGGLCLSVSENYSIPEFDRISINLTPKKNEGFMKSLFGYVDENDDWVIEPHFQAAEPFDSNQLAVVKKSGAWGIINPQGQFIVSPQCEHIGQFSENGLARVKMSGQYGFIDTKGNSVIPPQFEYAYSFEANVGLAQVQTKGKYGFVNADGDFVIKPQFDSVSGFSANGLAAAKITEKKAHFYSIQQQKFGFINTRGEWVISPQFDKAHPFNSNGLALVKKDDKEFYIDEQGNFIQST